MTSIHAVALPVRVQVDGLPPADRDAVAVTAEVVERDIDTSGPLERNAPRLGEAFQWDLNRMWIKSLHIHFGNGALERISEISVTIGAARTTYPAGAVRHWPRIPLVPWALLNAPHPDASLAVPFPPAQTRNFFSAINWPSRGALVRVIVLPSVWFFAFLAAITVAFPIALRSPAFERFTVRTLIGDYRRPFAGSRLWAAFGFMVVVAGIVIFERMRPYAFTQDDNFNQFMPVVIRSGETLLHGRMPVWNPYQLLGSPTTTLGTYMLTYPPTYLSWALARFLFHNDFLTMEIFVLLHLLAGYFATYWALRRMDVRRPFSAVGAFSFVLSGWFLVAGSSQATFLPFAVFLPLLFDAVNRLFAAPVSWRWAFWAAAIIGISFHAGHAQMWTYAVTFFALSIMTAAFSGHVNWRRAAWAAPAILFGLALAAPLLVLQFQETRHILRSGGYGTGAVLSTMLLPLGPFAADTKLPSSINLEYASEMFHFGVLFAGAAALALLLLTAFALTCKPPGPVPLKAAIAHNPWLLMALIAGLLSMGNKGLLWTAISFLPVFDKFRWPIKFAPFVALSAIFAGAIVVERLLGPKRSAAARWFTFASAALILFHVTLCRSTFYTMAGRPYPPFPEPARKMLTGNDLSPQRFVALNPARSVAPGYFQSLALNFATQLKLVAFDGYDSFVAAKPENSQAAASLKTNAVQTAKLFGARWLLVHDISLHPRFSPNPVLQSSESVTLPFQKALWELRARGRLAWHEGELWLYELPDPQPLAFSSSAPGQPLPLALDQSGISIYSDRVPSGAVVTAAFLWRPWMSARLDGKSVAPAPDQFGRLTVKLPRRAGTIRFEYTPPWGSAFAIGLILSLAALGSGLILNRFPEPAEAD